MPPITEHEFRRRFYACYNRCSMSKVILLSAFHRCYRVCRQSQVLSRIPKKTWRLEENGDTREIFWGILAMEDISFLVVSIYHFLILGPGFIFWFLWLFSWTTQAIFRTLPFPLWPSELVCLSSGFHSSSRQSRSARVYIFERTKLKLTDLIH